MDIDDLKFGLYCLHGENYDLRNRIEDLRNDAKNMNKKNEELKDKYNELNEKFDSIQDQNSNLNKELDSIKYENNNLKSNLNLLNSNYNSLKWKNESNERQLNNLAYQNQNLIKRQEEEENRKMIEKQTFNNFKKAFGEDKNFIEKKSISNSKRYITNFIINEFVKEFELENNVKTKFAKTLVNYMNKFTQEFMTYNQVFIQNFKINSQNIVKNYKVNDKSVSIEHINFIAIGKAGTGKSSFINECLLLPKEKRAKEGEGISVTEKSSLYCSEKLKMIRIWDTQGLDYKISQKYILNEVKRIVDEGLKKGPDHYINVILYCTCGNRFQEEDGQLIHEIMKLYPMDNLPVIITQLQAYFAEDAKRMEKIIRKILSNYLENKIVEKIEIKSLISRDKKVEDKIYKAYGIPELLKLSFDITGRAITSATFKKFSQDIENMCRKYVDEKIDFIQKIFKDENEILEIAKDKYVDGSDKYYKDEDKKYKNLNKNNIYNKIRENNYFINNFIKISSSKFLNIYNNLNNLNYVLEMKEKPLVLIFILDRLGKIQKVLNDYSENVFEEIYKPLFQEHLSELHLQQSSRKKEFNVNYDVIDSYEINQHLKQELFQYFKDEFFKYFFCMILKLFKTNLQNILIDNYKKELEENKEMIQIINEKAEYSLKYVCSELKSKLIKELDKYYPKNREKREIKKFNIDFSFPEY